MDFLIQEKHWKKKDGDFVASDLEITGSRSSLIAQIEEQSLETRLHETASIVFQMENLIKNGVSPSEIAVLYAKHKQANRLLTLLQKKGIPCQTKRPVNILDLSVIQQFRELLKNIPMLTETCRGFSSHTMGS